MSKREAVNYILEALKREYLIDVHVNEVFKRNFKIVQNGLIDVKEISELDVALIVVKILDAEEEFSQRN